MTHITGISLKGFESHEDTVLDGLAPGLNAVVGPSNSGKSAIVRALALVAYNQFDPKSLRTGCANCEVEVTTTNGKVKVVRGKDNVWSVTDRSGKTSHFAKIGKQILPQVAEVLGFGLVKLGDIEMKANIMDQLEAHFMLAEFDGQDATGSLRAQVVDEISGLSGIEGLIRDVGLDNNRLTRETNQTEERLKEVGTQLHDETVLDQEDKILAAVQAALTLHSDNVDAVVALTEMGNDHRAALGEVDRLRDEQANLPAEQKALSVLGAAEDSLNDIGPITQTHAAWTAVRDNEVRLKAELGALPDEAAVAEQAQRAQASLERADKMRRLSVESVAVYVTATNLRAELTKLGDSERVKDRLTAAEQVLAKRKAVIEFHRQTEAQMANIIRLKGDLSVTEQDEKEAERQRDAAMADIDVCPLTLKPISGECLKGAKA